MLLAASVVALSLALQQDPVRVDGSLSSTRTEVGSPVTLRVTVETRGEAPTGIHLPQLPRDVDVVGTSDFTQMMIGVPGGRSRVTRREFVIVAHRPGTFRIPAVTVDVGGRSYRTRALDLHVAAGPAAGPPGGAAPPAWSSPFDAPTRSTLRMWVMPDTVYVGQQVLLHAEATFGDDARPRQSRAATFDPPAPSGFWIQDVPNPVSVSLRVREGRTIETQTFRRAYFPLGPGRYTIPPAKLFYESRRGFLSAPETRQISSDSARLVVLPLPAQGRPASFSGAVGRLRMRATVVPTRVAIGEAAMVTVEVEGVGNVKALPEPQLPPIPEVDVLAPTQESSVEVVNLNVAGTKRFRWVVVPRRAGTITLPPVEYSVFDPELRQYVVLLTDTLRIEVAASVDVAAEDTLLRPLRGEAGREPAAWARTGLFAALQGAPLLILALAVAARRRRERPPGPREHYRRVRRELAVLRAAGSRDTLPELERLLVDAAACVAGASGSDPVAGLREQGRGGAAYALANVLREISRARFAPDAAEQDTAQVFARAEGFLEMIEPPSRWRAGRSGSALGVLLLSFAAAGAAHGSGGTFREAVARYDAGDYAAAAAAFHAYARSAPRDPAGWYNLGMAAHAAGDHGRAAWAWLRAARLSPRDADLLHNLRRVGAERSARQARPPDLLATGERAILAAAGWWLLVLGIALRRRAPRGARAGVAAGVLVLVLVSAVLLLDAARPVAVTPMSGGAPAFAGPSIHDEQVGSLHVGSLSRVLENRGDWLRVRLATDREAWVERSRVAAP